MFNNGYLASGTQALQNVAVGSKSLYNNTTGSSNTGIGYQALYNTATGDGNTACGTFGLYNLTSGSNNTVIGYNAYPYESTSYSNYTGIGYYVGTADTSSNRVDLGNTSVNHIVGDVAMSLYSDKRIKIKVKEDIPGLDFIGKLRPVSYNIDLERKNMILYAGKKEQMGDWPGKYDIEKIRMTGFIAQEVEQVAREAH